MYLSDEDFISACSDLRVFMDTDLLYDAKESMRSGFPVGRGYNGIKVNFNHDTTFYEAIQKWNRRKARIDLSDLNKIGVVMTYIGDGNRRIVELFDDLPLRNKQILVNKKTLCCRQSAYYINCPDFEDNHIWEVGNKITRKRYIDQLDYVNFLNGLC